MPSPLRHPGVHIGESSSGPHTILGVAASNTAFVGFFRRGPLKRPVRVGSFAEFEREFDGLDRQSPTSYAVEQYFLNGGRVALVVRVAAGAPSAARIELLGGDPAETVLVLEASSEGSWGTEVEVAVGHPAGEGEGFDLAVRRVRDAEGERRIVASEVHRGLSMRPSDSSFVKEALASSSRLVRATGPVGADRPLRVGSGGGDPTDPTVLTNVDSSASPFAPLTGSGDMDGAPPGTSAQLIDGVKSLDGVAPDLFNLLAMPEAASLPTDAERTAAYSAAESFCDERKAFLLVDIPEAVNNVAAMSSWLTNVGSALGRNAAVYFPRLEIPDRLHENRSRNVAASGTIAGVYARIDETRGVWKAPAGQEALLRGASVVTRVSASQNESLNRQGVNVLRSLPGSGDVVWGARTLAGADQQASEWKYVPVRRTALFIEESLLKGTQWALFEPNDESLWAQIQGEVVAFMQELLHRGAFQGITAREAYFVKCDHETTTLSDIASGVFNILVGFAPLEPAEFVLVKIRQRAGQSQS